MNIREHDCVVLTADLAEDGLQNAAGYEVEFMTLGGETVAVTTEMPGQLRPVGKRDVTHVRELAAA
jgi:hypothetical protein